MEWASASARSIAGCGDSECFARRRRHGRGGRRVFHVEGVRMKAASKSRLPIYAIVVFTVAMCPAAAEAHLNSTGMGPVYDGLMHFLTSAEDVVPVLALALLAGLRGADLRSPSTLRASHGVARGWTCRTCCDNGEPQRGADRNNVPVAGRVGRHWTPSFRCARRLHWQRLIGLYHGYLNGAGMGQPGIASVALARTRVRRVHSGRTGRRTRRSTASGMGAHRGAGRRQLDRRQRTAHARVEPARQALKSSMSDPCDVAAAAPNRITECGGDSN